MNDRRIVRALASVVMAGATACHDTVAQPPAATGSGTASAPAAAVAAVPHGDHNPRHGGVVMMKGELHYEVRLDPAGRSHQLFFSDAVREDLPASMASSAAFAIRRPDGTDESIPLHIDNAGESWIGSGRPVEDETKTTVRVAFTIGGEPYVIDLPYAVAR